jgi:hypothetical protein
MKTTKADFLEEIMAGRARLETVLAGIPVEKMEQVVLYQAWSLKDYLAHLGFWATTVVSLFEILRTGKTPEPFPTLDEVNAQAHEESRSKSFEEVCTLEKDAYESVLNLVQRASDDELYDPHHFAWTAGRAFSEFIADNTFGHYEEHMPDLLEALKELTE